MKPLFAATDVRPPQSPEDTLKLLEASLVLVRLRQDAERQFLEAGAITKPSAFKVCGCGRVFATRADFNRLPLCGSGYQPQFDEHGDECANVRLCCRNCSCGSTLYVEEPFAFVEPAYCSECDEWECCCPRVRDCMDLEMAR